MRSTRCGGCRTDVEVGITFCNCGFQMAPLERGFDFVHANWLQAPLLAPGTDSEEVVGEGYRQGAIDRVAGGKTADGARRRWHTAQLVPERNPYDAKAIMVLVGAEHVGYLSSDDTAWAHRLLAAGHRPLTVRAEIRGGWIRPDEAYGDDREGSYGVRLWHAGRSAIFELGVHPFVDGFDVAIAVLPEAKDAALGLAGRRVPAVMQVSGGVWVGVPGAWIGRLKPPMAERHGPLLHRIQSAGLPLVSTLSVTVGAKGQPLAKVELPSSHRVTELLASC